MRGFTFSLLILVFLASGLSTFAQTYNKDYADGKLYFKFKDNVQVTIPVNPDRSVDLDNAPVLDGLREQYSIAALWRPFDLNNDPKLLKTFELVFTGFDEIEELMAALGQNPDIEFVERVPLMFIDYHPNDELYNYAMGSGNWNWHLDVVNAEGAWDITMGDPDIHIAIVDNAVWIDHEDLEDQIFLSWDVTAPPGNNNSNPPSTGSAEAWSHGTHCAGLASAHTDNVIGVAGLGFNTTLIGVKCTSDNGNPSTIGNGYGGIQWAANNGADVISMSWGGQGYSTAHQNILNSVHDMGIVLIASAGNDNVTSNHYPSAYNHVISVASTDEDDLKSWFSNYGNSIDLCAPGGDGIQGPSGLLSTVFSTTSFGHYDTFFGTSMSTPFAAGLCGLILSLNPGLSPDEVENIMKTTSFDIYTLPGNQQYLNQLGAGRIDAYEAVLNTPFTPVADFSTPVPYIMPGTTIDFTDLSEGVPNIWSWLFDGGDPAASGDQDPSVTYNDEGEYDVSLTVSNDWGSDNLAITDYITVTATPVPWVLFSADTNQTCVSDVVAFTDASLYDPTSWLWEFDPNHVTFVNGTNPHSQHPEVTFDMPGTYTVTLTATNANGNGIKTIHDMIPAEGIELNFSDDFESGESSSLVLSNNERAGVNVDERAASPGSQFGLHFEGGGQTGNWSGGPFDTTPEEAWEENVLFHGFAQNCHVDANGVEGVTLSLDLRQTYSVGNMYSWFRVLIDGAQVADVNGVQNFNPETNEDPWKTITFDLSPYGNSGFSITLQSSCYLADGFGGLEGDNVFVDNVMISNTTGTGDDFHSSAGVLTYPNPARDILHFSVNGLGQEIQVQLLNVQGQVVYHTNLAEYIEGNVEQINISHLTEGVYILHLRGNESVVTKKLVVR